MRLALALTAIIIAPALGITIVGRLACWAVERALSRRAAPRRSAAQSDEAARREVLCDWRVTSFDPPGGIDA